MKRSNVDAARDGTRETRTIGPTQCQEWVYRAFHGECARRGLRICQVLPELCRLFAADEVLADRVDEVLFRLGGALARKKKIERRKPCTRTSRS